jgi:hypothetical protein
MMHHLEYYVSFLFYVWMTIVVDIDMVVCNIFFITYLSTTHMRVINR